MDRVASPFARSWLQGNITCSAKKSCRTGWAVRESLQCLNKHGTEWRPVGSQVGQRGRSSPPSAQLRWDLCVCCLLLKAPAGSHAVGPHARVAHVSSHLSSGRHAAVRSYRCVARSWDWAARPPVGVLRRSGAALPVERRHRSRADAAPAAGEASSLRCHGGRRSASPRLVATSPISGTPRALPGSGPLPACTFRCMRTGPLQEAIALPASAAPAVWRAVGICLRQHVTYP